MVGLFASPAILYYTECVCRLQAGSLLELAANGKRYFVHSTEIHVWYLEASPYSKGKD